MKTTKIHDQSHVERLFRVLNMIQSVRFYKTAEIAEMLGVSERTVHRYIDEFRNSGLDIVVRSNCFRLDLNSHRNRMVLNLISGTDEWKTLCNVDQFATAVKQHRCVEIEEYTSGHSCTIRTREVEPFEITDNHKFVWCYDPKDGHCKTFRPSRCKSVTVLNKPWANAGSFRSEDIDIFGFHGSEPIKVRIRLDIMAYNLLLEEFPEAQRCVSQSADDEWLLDADVYDLRGVGRFCLGLLKHIKIADTPKLKEYLLSEYKSITQS